MGLHNSPRLRDTVPGAAPCDEGFRSLAEACPDAVLVAQDGRFVYANAAAAHVHGYADAAEFLARPMEALVAAEDLHDVKARITEVLSGVGPVPHECEYHAVHRNGQAIAMTMSSRRITFGDRPAVLSFGHDVSDRKRLERKLLDSDRMAAVGTLAAGVAHEVNNPLTYVLLNLRRLRRSLPGFIGTGADRELCEQLLDEALDGSERVRLIVKDLLELGRPTAPDPVPTQVATVVESAVKLVRTSLRHRAQIIRHYRPSPPILANPTRLGQVFLNLLINAGQSFHTDDVDHNEIHIGVGPRGHDRVTVEVRDNGIGIVGGNRERIFDPFFTTKPVGTGVGLGLTVARSIVESLGGQLALEPSERGGAFRIDLPSQRHEPPSGQRRVLVVDDNGPLAHQLDVILARGCEVIALADSRKALAMASSESDLGAVCCDLDRAAGLALFSEACEHAPALVKRMVVLASPSSADRRKAGDRGATVLVRPLVSGVFDEALAALL